MIHKYLWLLALLAMATHCPAQQTGSNTGGFVGSDAGETGPPSFRASGVQGSTAPSGYSAGASAEPAPIVLPGSVTEMSEHCTPIPHVSTVRFAQMLFFAAEEGGIREPQPQTLSPGQCGAGLPRFHSFGQNVSMIGYM